jgi:hypothetical protein|tara:strand:+ start:2071 stop:2268 length:198 start_codon:yes stop_codon:yes gene_type:complete
MDLYPLAQDFLDGQAYCKKHSCEEIYVQYFLETYKDTGNSKYSKNNAVRLAMCMVDTHTFNHEIL